MCCRNAAARANTNMDRAPIANRRRVGWLHDDHGNLFTLQRTLPHGQRGRRHDIAVGFHVGRLPEQFIGDRQRTDGAVVLNAYENESGLIVTGQIVGKRTDGFADFGGVGAG